MLMGMKTNNAIITVEQGSNQLFISGGLIFMKFHSMTSWCLFNRGTTFLQTVTDKFLFATFPVSVLN